MKKDIKIKIFIGFSYLTLVGLFLYYLFTNFTFQQLTSYDFIKDNVEFFYELKKTNLIKTIKFDVKKEICLIEYISIEIHPSQIRKIVKNAGYELKSIRWLKNKKPNRYNTP